MITVNPIEIDGMHFTAVKVELPKTNLLTISNEVGYIMCAALDVTIFNEIPALMKRNVIAGRAMGVRTIDQLLNAPLEKITDASREYGWEEGMTGREALLKIS
ncbi:YunC family protein [Oceanobacillus sp. FSL H7-0719]|uniref:YunC family protein n=1 Tax=Oceanobacillus sp. FSL H7-0719 TaxID=2954507 RepID=UPI003254223B